MYRLIYAKADEREEAHDEALVDFVGVLLDCVLPRDREGNFVFTVDRKGEKTLPRDTITHILLSHAVLKRELHAIKIALFEHWKKKKTEILYLSSFFDEVLEVRFSISLMLFGECFSILLFFFMRLCQSFYCELGRESLHTSY